MSPPPRLFVKGILAKNQQLVPDDGQKHYLSNVLRRRSGDKLRLFNGKNGEWLAELRPDRSLHLLRKLREQTQPDRCITLWCPILRPARQAFLIEKATELGVALIGHTITEYSCHNRQTRVDRLERIAVQAAEQAERLTIPDIETAKTLPERLLHKPQTVLYCDEAGDQPDQPWGGRKNRATPLAEILLKQPLSATMAILIGPEGGFSPEEQTHLRQENGVIPVSLGSNILRAETACLAALTLWQALHGLLQYPEPSGHSPLQDSSMTDSSRR